MQVAHQAFQPFLQHVGIDLRGRDVGVAEQRLHDAQVGAVVQQVAGEGVAQHVRAHLLGAQPGAGRERLQFAREMLAGEVAAVAERGEQPLRVDGLARRLRFRGGVVGRCAAVRQQRAILGHRGLGGVVERHQPFLAALAAHDQHARVALRRRGRQRHQLGHPQPGGVDQLQQRVEPRRAQPLAVGAPVADRGARGGEQAVDVLDAEHLRQRASALRPFDDGGGIVAALSFGIEEAIELPDRRQPPRHRRRGEASAW